MRTLHKPLLLAATCLAFFANGALAHGDEDHGQDARKPAAVAPTAAVPGVSSGPAALQRLADGSLFVPKSVQHQLGIRTQSAKIGDLAATVELNGKVISDPNTSGRVQASFSGSVMPGPKGMPTPGRKVARGEVLAWLRPVASAIERGNQKAQLAELEFPAGNQGLLRLLLST